ncbi:amidohydrolase family protein [Fannyhessea vaginae]|uniref:amidohydrolase family protein n=1 Tax=Fannyhessea vaginae TaxID=82135 RepID=UPI003B220BB3
MLIYDIHSHFGPTSSGECVTASDMYHDLSSYGIQKVGISCLSGVSTVEQNDLVYTVHRELPDFVEAYAFINPKDPHALDEIDRCLGDLKMNGVKFHSWKQGYYPDNRPELDDIFSQIEHYGVHVQMHVGTAPLSNPYTWSEHARKHPKIDFVFTHMGYYEFGLSCIEMALRYKNIYLETSGQMNPLILKDAIKKIGSQRIVFGTDWPYKPVNIEIDKFLHLDLDSDDLENIFYKNAMYLWRQS